MSGRGQGPAKSRRSRWGNRAAGVAVGAFICLALLLACQSYAPYPRWDLLALTGVMGLCLAVLWWYGTGNRRRGLREIYEQAVRETAPAASSRPRSSGGPALPRRLPRASGSRRRSQAAPLVGILLFPVVLLLLHGPQERSEQVAAIARSGSVITSLPVAEVASKVDHSENSKGKDYYEADVVVELPDDKGAKHRAVVPVRTEYDPPRPGTSVAVLYSPTDTALGAVSGDRGGLRKLRSGGALSASWTLGLGAVAALALLLAGIVGRWGVGGRRGWLGRVTPHGYAVRVRIADGASYDIRSGEVSGSARTAHESGADINSVSSNTPAQRLHPCLLLELPDGQVPFVLPPQLDAPLAADVLDRPEVWLYFGRTPRDKSGHSPRAHAVLIGDEGWVLRGHLSAPGAKAAAAQAQHPAPDSLHRERVRDLDLHAGWPALLRPAALWVATIAWVALACTVAPLPGNWRLVALGVTALGAAFYWPVFRGYRDERQTPDHGKVASTRA